MKILALDQSSHVTGYAIFEDNQLIKYGHFESRGHNLGERLQQFKLEIINLIEAYEIEQVIFEDIQLQQAKSDCAWGPAYDGNGVGIQTFKILAEVIGVLSELLEELHLPYDCVLPIVWKRKIGIKGKDRATQKKNTVQYVFNHFDFKVTEDEADAIGIGIYYHIIKNLD